MTATVEISTIIRARLAEGRAIADEDVRALLNENARLRKALRPLIQTGTVQVGYRVKLDGQEPPPITASEEEAWAHYGGSDFYYQQWLQWRAVQIGRELLGETQ
jgi:hypothetical protein